MQPGGQVINFQPWLSLTGVSGSGDVTQPARHWLNGTNFATCNMQVQAMSVVACTLVLESASSVEGPWSTITSYQAAADAAIVLSSEGGTQKFSNLVRWRINPSGAAAWNICFKLKATASGSKMSRVKAPRRV